MIGLLIAAGIGAIHFALGLMLTSRVMLARPETAAGLAVFSIPYFLLFVAFVWGYVDAARRRLRRSARLVLVAWLLAAGLCAYDLSHGERAQISGGGVGNTYFYWWWYYEPFWYGYVPGNV